MIYKKGSVPSVFCEIETARLKDEAKPLKDNGDDIMAQCPIEQEDSGALFTTPDHLGRSGIGKETMTAIAEQVEQASYHAILSCIAMLLRLKMAACSLPVLT